jgi:adenylosuccinate synthase
MHKEVICYIGNGVVLSPEALFKEIGELESAGLDVMSRLKISEATTLILPYHVAIDHAREKKRGEAKIGTTGRGIGPAYEDKVARRALRVQDLFYPEKFALQLKENLDYHNFMLTNYYGAEPVSYEKTLAEAMSYAERLKPMVVDVSSALYAAEQAGQNLLFEGAQGTLLDIDHGTYPYVTSSNPVAGGACIGAGVGPTLIDRVIGVAKAYTTRVGEGPFPTELDGSLSDHLCDRGGEYGTTTGRPRRCGWLDLVAVKYSVMVCGADAIACTLLDVLSGFDELRICVGYRRADGTVTDRFIPDAERMHGFTPVYETLPGWQRELTDCTDRDDLPREAQSYLAFVEKFVGIPVELVSVGPERTQTFESNARFASMA